ncbi:MAG: transposase [Hyphomicrobiaceae bacterium]|nr:transposase [Hyphomicrobiaceae bacterium]
MAWRWPNGFVCPTCGGVDHCIVGPRKLFQCNACRRQTSPTAGTVFASTKVPLTTWFRAMYLITQTKQGIKPFTGRTDVDVVHSNVHEIGFVEAADCSSVGRERL